MTSLHTTMRDPFALGCLPGRNAYLDGLLAERKSERRASGGI